MNVYENIKRLNLTLPEAPPPGGLYVPIKQAGNLVFTSGHGPIVAGKPAFTGKLTSFDGKASDYFGLSVAISKDGSTRSRNK